MEDVIGTEEASQLLGITPRHAARLAAAGEFEARRLGREWVISRQSVLDYIARQKRDKSGDNRPNK